MNERENFINNLERAINLVDGEGREFVKLTIGDVKRILQLIKEQEAVRPRYIDGKRNHLIKCGKCNTDLMSGMKYCPRCGQAVKWDERKLGEQNDRQKHSDELA